MVSTLAILIIAVLSLWLVWKLVSSGPPDIRSLDDWERNKHEVDLAAFRLLLDPREEHFLRQALLPREFRRFQRARCRLALRSLSLLGENSAMLIKLGHLARSGANAALAREADDLIAGALRLRVHLLSIQPCLWLKWMFPGWMLPAPNLKVPYEELLAYLSRVRQQQVNPKEALIAG